MVSTRRSRSQQEGCPSGDAPGLGSPDAGSQGEVASRRRGGAGLEPIAEEAQRAGGGSGAATAAAAAVAATAAAAEQPSQGSQQPRARRPQQQQQQQQQVQQEPAASSSEDGGGGTSDGGSDSESEDLSDMAFDGPDVLQSLAAAIQSGFNSTPGAQQQVQQFQHHPQPQKPQKPQEPDPAQLRWRPHTGLHVPAKAAAAAALTAATAPGRRRKQGQGQQDGDQQQPGGPLVAGGAAPSGPAAAAAKDPALSKALVAPTLDAAAREREARKSAPDTAGKAWFGLPAPKITEDVKRDLRLLRLRGAYDPKRFYKGFDDTKFPKYFAIGTVQSDALDPPSSRLPAGQRGASLTQQLLADADITTNRKKRYNKLQDEAQRWVKAKKRKTGMPRHKPSKTRPKH